MFKQANIAKVLGQVIVAAAWVDGMIQDEERSCLKDLLFQLPELPSEDWNELNALLSQPIDRATRMRFVGQLKSLLISKQDKHFVLYALERLVNADGVVTPSERRFVDAVQHFLFSEDDITLDELDRMIHEPEASSAKLGHAAHSHPQQTPPATVSCPCQPPKNSSKNQAKKLELAGVLMARVIHASQHRNNLAEDKLRQYLRKRWGLQAAEAEYTVKVALAHAPDETIDAIRTCRQFYESTTPKERIEFLDVLFQVAIADGKMTDDEVQEIVDIAANLKLEHEHFQDALEKFSAQVSTA